MPREGGNIYKFSFFGTKVTPGFQGDNYTQDLKSRGLTSPNKLKEAYDFNGSGGGPIVKDKLWFFASVRRQLNQTLIAGMYYNLNAGDASKWAYAPDLANQAYFSTLQPGLSVRGTWQESPRNKFSLSYDVQPRDVFGDRATTSPESANNFKFNKNQIIAGSWSSPVTSRLLLDARLDHARRGPLQRRVPRGSEQHLPQADRGDGAGRVDSRAAVSRRRPGGGPDVHLRGDVGAEHLAVQDVGDRTSRARMRSRSGSRIRWSRQYLLERDIDSSTSYRFNNGVPNQITERASPVSRYDDMKAELSIFVQDKWTLNKLTLTGGLRFDYFNTYFPETPLGPGPLVPTRNFTVPEYKWDNWKDLSPRVAAVYDLFGNGKTAVKVNLGRYVLAGDPTVGNVFSILANTVTRSWDDRAGRGINGDYVPQCDLMNPNANGECGAISDFRFGTQVPSTVLRPGTS